MNKHVGSKIIKRNFAKFDFNKMHENSKTTKEHFNLENIHNIFFS